MKNWSTSSAAHQIAQHLPLVATATLGVAAGAGLIAWWMISRRETPQEIERQRREYLVEHGRIIDGTVLDWTEQTDTGDLKTLLYTYEISGVTYECAQDLSYMQDRVRVDPSCLGMPASIRYDSKNPANSIIVAEEWSGLRFQKPRPERLPRPSNSVAPDMA
ncbi:MAG TPA: hypothetical protein VFN53_05440 [Acidobacteriaceae bacterium]|nr:hypothetical protein [Acidobacteriaceae bacterium]